MNRETAFGVILLAVMVVFLGVAIYWLAQPVHVEGEVIGKEERKKAFLSNSPPMLVVNLTDGDPVLVCVSTVEFHQYEVGDWFNDTKTRGGVGSGIDCVNMVKPFVAVLPLIVFMIVMTSVMGRRYR